MTMTCAAVAFGVFGAATPSLIYVFITTLFLSYHDGTCTLPWWVVSLNLNTKVYLCC
jgi:hypothetical protein